MIEEKNLELKSRALKVLLLEDSRYDAELIERELKNSGMNFVVQRTDNRKEFIEAISGDLPDLILADYHLPSFDGMMALKMVRERNIDSPFIFVSGAIGEELAIETLKKGATDYILKSSISRLNHSVKRALREYEEHADLKAAENELYYSFEKMQKMMDGTICAMSKILEIRDPYTAGHEQRVTKIATEIGNYMKLNREQLVAINMASAVHDVGKIYVPAEILNKPGKLNEIEYKLIKMHPQAGFDILNPIDFPWSISDIVLQHHERVDGSGYPVGLKAKNICIESKVIAVADVVEAMSSHRPYRPALGIDYALEEISKKRNIFYDKDVVDACCNVFKDIAFAAKIFA